MTWLHHLGPQSPGETCALPVRPGQGLNMSLTSSFSITGPGWPLPLLAQDSIMGMGASPTMTLSPVPFYLLPLPLLPPLLFHIPVLPGMGKVAHSHLRRSCPLGTEEKMCFDGPALGAPQNRWLMIETVRSTF